MLRISLALVYDQPNQNVSFEVKRLYEVGIIRPNNVARLTLGCLQQ